MTRGKIKEVLGKMRGRGFLILAISFLILAFLGATLLRIDHIRMVELKSAVLAADRENDDAKISERLTELRDFTASHIIVNIIEKNGQQELIFGTGPFYLQNQYARAADAAVKQAEEEAMRAENGNVYAAASAVCQPLAIKNGWVWNSSNYIDCMMGEIAKYPTAETLDFTAKIPSTELFRYDFLSPVWTFSLSGLVILTCLIILVVFLVRLLILVILKIRLFLKKVEKKS